MVAANYKAIIEVSNKVVLDKESMITCEIMSFLLLDYAMIPVKRGIAVYTRRIAVQQRDFRASKSPIL